METIHLLNNQEKQRPPAEFVKFRLYRKIFFKPVRNIEKKVGSTIDTAYDDISNARMNLNMILYVYSLLDLVPDIERFVLFPCGVVSTPSIENSYGVHIRQLLLDFMRQRFPQWPDSRSYVHIPFLMFAELCVEDGWQLLEDSRPPLPLVGTFLAELSKAISAVNLAKVAHMDLRYE